MSMKENIASNIENQQVQDVVQTVPLREFIHAQYLKYIAHVCRHENSSKTATCKGYEEMLSGSMAEDYWYIGCVR